MLILSVPRNDTMLLLRAQQVYVFCRLKAISRACCSAFFYAAFAACWYLQTGGSEVERVMHNLAPGEEL
jgi:hypothetical protein